MEQKRPVVVVADPFIEVDQIRTRANVLQFAPPSAVGNSFTKEQLHQWIFEHIAEADVLFIRSSTTVDAPLLDAAKALKAVVTISVGYDTIDVAECAKRGIKLGYAGSAFTETTAETTVALLLAASRRIPEAVQIAKDGKWPQNWHPDFCVGKALEGSVVGIFGMGRIGHSVARKLHAFRPAEIIFHNRRTEKAQNANGTEDAKDKHFRWVPFDELIGRSDFLLITASVNAQTKGLFGEEVFGRMKRGAILVNVSRGCIVRTDDLCAALQSGKLGGAALDVTDPEPLPNGHPLFALPNCVITPHIGSATEVALRRMMALGQANVLAALEGAQMPSPILP